jgi:hypothetical protein
MKRKPHHALPAKGFPNLPKNWMRNDERRSGLHETQNSHCQTKRLHLGYFCCTNGAICARVLGEIRIEMYRTTTGKRGFINAPMTSILLLYEKDTAAVIFFV